MSAGEGAGADLRDLPHTSYPSNFAKMKPESAVVREISGVRLQKDGFDVYVDLMICDDEMNLDIRVAANPKALFVHFQCYEIGMVDGEGIVYGVDDESLDWREMRALEDEVASLRARIAEMEARP